MKKKFAVYPGYLIGVGLLIVSVMVSIRSLVFDIPLRDSPFPIYICTAFLVITIESAALRIQNAIGQFSTKSKLK